MLKPYFNVLYDQQGSIGKRYYRQDEAGTPYGITVDHQTMEDNTVTLRHRDTQKQDRVDIDSILNIIQSSLIWEWPSYYEKTFIDNNYSY